MTKFSGEMYKRQEFIDCFSSAINGNDALSDVDKFTYLQSYIDGTAKACIAGFTLTAVQGSAEPVEKM